MKPSSLINKIQFIVEETHDKTEEVSNLHTLLFLYIYRYVLVCNFSLFFTRY